MRNEQVRHNLQSFPPAAAVFVEANGVRVPCTAIVSDAAHVNQEGNEEKDNPSVPIEHVIVLKGQGG